MRLRSVLVPILTVSALVSATAAIGQSLSTSIPVITSSGIISTFAGNGQYTYSGDGSKATVAAIATPLGITFHDGSLYIADSANGVVRVVNSSGIITTFAGNNAIKGTYSGDGGQATSAGLNHPSDVAFDAAGNLYIADTGNNVIREVSTSGTISTFAGTGKQGYNGDGAAATSAEMSGPDGLAIDLSTSDVFIADAGNHVIREVTASNSDINTIAGTGTAGNTGNGGQAIDAELNSPAGMYFTQGGSNLYFADPADFVVRVINLSTGVIGPFAGSGTQGNLGDTSQCKSGKAVDANLIAVTGITFDVSGNAYLSNYVVYGAPYGFAQLCEVDPAGDISVVAGGDPSGFSGDGGAAASAEINQDSYLTFDPSGDLYIADTANNRIRKITPLTDSPTFSQASGTYATPISITISDPLSSAQIYYTLNGTTPGTGSTLYTQPISVPVGQTTTIQAIAVDGSYPSSLVVSATYTVAVPTATPVFVTPVGTYLKSVSVKISDATQGAVIHCTTNGSTPTTTSPVCSGTVDVTKTETIKAIAVAPGHEPSAAASATYTIDVGVTATPTFSVPSGTYEVEKLLTLDDATAGAVIYYKPSTASAFTKYVGPVAVSQTETIEAYAVAATHEASATEAKAYVIIDTPSALIAPATSIATTSATANALVSTGGAAGTASFEYGTSSTALTKTTATKKLAASTDRVIVSTSITGLKAKTTYYYRVSVTSLGGTATSAVSSFTTN
jgi:hypothetical protein